MSLARSEDMIMIQLFIDKDSVYDLVAEIGNFGYLHFVDFDSEQGINLLYMAKELYIVNKLMDLMDSFKRIILTIDSKTDFVSFCNETTLVKYQAPKIIQLEIMNVNLSSILLKFNLANNSLDNMTSSYKNFLEKLIILDSFTEVHANLSLTQDMLFHESSFQHHGDNNGISISCLGCIISKKKSEVFTKIFQRSCKLHVYSRQFEFNDRKFCEFLYHSAYNDCLIFLIYYQGDVIQRKLEKICKGLNLPYYLIQPQEENFMNLKIELKSKLIEYEKVISLTIGERDAYIQNFIELYEEYAVKVFKAQKISETLKSFNFKSSKSILYCKGWCIKENYSKLLHFINLFKERTQATASIEFIESEEPIPTHFVLNKYTRAFQGIVSSYGIADYKEINPTIFALVSFPFLFAVMFGDVGHGILLLLISLFFIWKEKSYSKDQKLSDLVKPPFQGRYILLLISFFSIYLGFIYNEVFSKNMWLFSSGWRLPTLPFTDEFDLPRSGIETSESFCPNGCGFTNKPYVFGIDPIWGIASNKLSFLNSFKMKLSIITAVFHMSFGLIVGLFNHIYFKRYYAIFLGFLPEFVFYMSIFGYLAVLIIAKWATNFENLDTAPALLVLVINMFLAPTSGVNVDANTYFYSSQTKIQLCLLFMAGIFVPILLLGKPLYVYIKNRRKVETSYISLNSQSLKEETEVLHVVEPSESKFSEVLISQAIHTIEYCLGAISNTASYLRLWALSLAHAQLSEVLWNMIVVTTMNKNFFICALGFSGWFAITVAVMLVMEGLSAFLHTLRLHWVEFQGKFYHGTGFEFKPLDLNSNPEDE